MQKCQKQYTECDKSYALFLFRSEEFGVSWSGWDKREPSETYTNREQSFLETALSTKVLHLDGNQTHKNKYPGPPWSTANTIHVLNCCR